MVSNRIKLKSIELEKEEKEVKVIVANYRTGSTTFSQSIGGSGFEYLHKKIRDFTGPNEEQVFKIMPDNWQYEKHWEDFKRLYLDVADKIYICARRDFNAQISSHIYATYTKDWHPNNTGKPGLPNISNSILEEYKTMSYDLDLRNLEWQSKIYKEYDAELVWLEDRYDVKNKYTRKFNMEIPSYNFDVNPEVYFA